MTILFTIERNESVTVTVTVTEGSADSSSSSFVDEPITTCHHHRTITIINAFNVEDRHQHSAKQSLSFLVEQGQETWLSKIITFGRDRNCKLYRIEKSLK